MRTKMSIAGKVRHREAGFTYALVMVAVVIVGLTAGVATDILSREVRAEKEAELLFRGIAYRNAIESYYKAGQQHGRAGYPRTLEDLLRDPRFPNRRHIRKLYPEPFGSDNRQWLLIRATDGGITGVASGSDREPMKKAGFPKGLEHCNSATKYSEWTFEYRAENPVPGEHGRSARALESP